VIEKRGRGKENIAAGELLVIELRKRKKERSRDKRKARSPSAKKIEIKQKRALRTKNYSKNLTSMGRAKSE